MNKQSQTFPKSHQNTEELTYEDIALLRKIKKSIGFGYDVEIKGTSDGKLKALEVKKRIIPIE